MKKIITIFCIMVLGILSVSATEINIEDYENEIIISNTEETFYSPEATSNNIMTTSVEGTLEYVKTINGNGYISYVQLDANNRYWSKSTGYSVTYVNYLKNAIFHNPSYGSTASQYVSLFENEYLPRGSVLKFELNGTACGHTGSNAYVYISNPSINTMSYSHSNQVNSVGNLIIPANNHILQTNTLYYTIHKSGYYTVDALGVAYACTVSGGHGIYMNPTYYIYRYKYDISYNLNGGTLSKENPNHYYEEDGDIILNKPIKEGYTFIGWTGSNGNTPQTNVTIVGGSYGNRIYTANWKINQYPVTYIDIAPDGEEIGKTIKHVDWNSSVRGNDLGSNPAENVYYNGYYYVSDTSATVTTEGAIVYRNFEASNIDKEVNLNWNDNNNKDSVRPETYKLKLKQNGKVIDEVELPSSKTNYTFRDLPKYDSNGQKYEYSFDAEANDRYKISFDDNGNLIVENYQPASFSVIIPKTIVLNGNTGKADYIVSVNGTFYYNDTLKVIPEANFILTDRSNISSIKANVSQIKTGFTKEDINSITNGSIETEKNLFAGSWSGHFNFNIHFEMKN